MMKLLAYFLLFILLAFMSCSEPRGHREALSRALSVMNEHPDSALRILDSLGEHKQQFGSGFLMRYRLHRTNALNKLDTVFSSTTEVQQLADYFDSHGNANEQMLAHYLLGRAYYDTGESPMALKCFQDAAAKADTTAKDCDYRQLSLVYGQLGDLFDDRRSPKHSLANVRLAEKYAWKAKDTLLAILCYERQYLAYGMLNQTDSMLYICNTARDLYGIYGYNTQRARVLPTIVWGYLEKKKYIEAYQYFQEFENHSGLFNHGEIEKGLEYNYFFKGECFYGLNQLDSAEYYYRKLLKYTDNIDMAEVAYRGLMHLYVRKSVADSVFKYSQLYCDANDTASVRQASEEILRTQALYNYERSQREAEQMRRQSFIYYLMLVGLCVLVVVPIIIYVVYLFRQKKLREQRIEQQNQEYAKLYADYNKAQQDYELLLNNSEAYQHEQADTIRHYRNIIETYQESPSDTGEWNIEHYIICTELVRNLKKLATSGRQATASELNDLHKLILEHHPRFISNLQKQCPDLSRKEITVCILIRLNFTGKETAALLGISKQSLSNIRSEINMKLFHLKGTKNLDSGVLSL